VKSGDNEKVKEYSRANASRVYFGRTRPSSEVGVRERLRKILRKSSNPKETRFEMVGDKGYGSRLKTKEKDMTVKVNRGGHWQLVLEEIGCSNSIQKRNDKNALDFDSEGQSNDASEDAFGEI